MPGISPSVSGTEMSKRIKKLIKKIRHRLQWPVAENRAPGIDTLSIDSDSRARIHRINVPGHDVRDIEYLHELGHAWLCETVSPMFSGQTFGTVDIEVLSLIQPASQAASDWFVDHWIYTMAPAEERREIEAVYSQMGAWLKDNKAVSADILCAAALFVAQADRYCGRKTRVGGVLAQAVAAILTVDPSRPSLESLAAAINGLLACYAPYRVRPASDDGRQYWAVEKVDD